MDLLGRCAVRAHQGIPLEHMRVSCRVQVLKHRMLSISGRQRSASAAKSLIRCFSSTSSETGKKSGWSLTRLLLVSPPVLIGGWIATSEHPRASAALAVHFPLRLARDVYCVAGIVQGRFIFWPSSDLPTNKCNFCRRLK